MPRLMSACAATFVIMFIVPFPFYAGFEALGLVRMPGDGSPGEFMAGVVLMKLGIALGFVLLYRGGAPAWQGRLRQYAGIWWVMYAIIELGQMLGPDDGPGEALAGVLAEAVYFPLSAWTAARILRPPASSRPVAGVER